MEQSSCCQELLINSEVIVKLKQNANGINFSISVFKLQCNIFREETELTYLNAPWFKDFCRIMSGMRAGAGGAGSEGLPDYCNIVG